MNEKIFLLGCWNKNACLDKGTKDGRLEVINLLSREPKQYNFGILLGDNIYPLKLLKKSKKSITKFISKTKKKIKKPKRIKKFLSESSIYYDKIKRIANDISLNDIKLHVILGNHDVEKQCVRNHQISKFMSNSSIIYKNNEIFETENAVFLMLNTNNISNIIYFLEEFDISILKDRWLLICGHEPLYSYKPKKKKLFQKLTDVSSIFDAIYELNYNKLAYLCADTHNFQILELGEYSAERDFCFPIVVIGTGGANPDTLSNIESNKEYYDEKTGLYCSIKNYEDPYGFVEMDITKNNLIINYKKCGSVNKTTINFNSNNQLTYKNKYIKKNCDMLKPLCKYIDQDKNLFEICTD